MCSFARDGRLQEVKNLEIWLENIWYFGKLVAEERWSLARGSRNDRQSIMINLTAYMIVFTFNEKQSYLQIEDNCKIKV